MKRRTHIPYPLTIIHKTFSNILSAKLSTSSSDDSVDYLNIFEQEKELFSADHPVSYTASAFPLRNYPIVISYDPKISIAEISKLWSQYCCLKAPSFLKEFLPSYNVKSKALPYILIHDSENETNIDSTSINNFINGFIQLNTTSGGIFKNNDGDTLKYLSNNYCIVLDHKSIVNHYRDVFVNFFESNTDSKLQTNQKQQLINQFTEIIKKICKTLIFRFLPDSKKVSISKKCNLFIIDGTSIITSNPLLCVFFFYAFAPHSFCSKPHNSISTFKAINHCVNHYIAKKNGFDITEYFITVKSHALPDDNVNYTYGSFKCPLKMTYTLQNRLKQVMSLNETDNRDFITDRNNYDKLKKLDKNLLNQQQNTFLNKFQTKKRNISKEWNSSFFLNDDGIPKRITDFMHYYYDSFTKDHENALSNQLRSNQCFYLFDWKYMHEYITFKKSTTVKPKKPEIKKEEITTTKPKPKTIVKKEDNTEKDLKSELFKYIDDRFKVMEKNIIDIISKGFESQKSIIEHEIRSNIERIQSQEIQELMANFSNIELVDNNDLEDEIVSEHRKTSKRSIQKMTNYSEKSDSEDFNDMDVYHEKFGDLTKDYSDNDEESEEYDEESEYEEYDEDTDEGSVDLEDSSSDDDRKKPKKSAKQKQVIVKTEKTNLNTKIKTENDSKKPGRKKKANSIESFFSTNSEDIAKNIYSKYPVNTKDYKTIILNNIDLYFLKIFDPYNPPHKNATMSPKKIEFILPLLSCAIGSQYCLGKNVLVIPTGYIGYELYMNAFNNEDEQNPFLSFIDNNTDHPVWNTLLLRDYLELRKIISSQKSKRIQLNTQFFSFLDTHPHLKTLIRNYPDNHDYLICQFCRKNGDFTFTTSRCNVENPWYDSETNNEIFKCLQSISPSPISNDYFSLTTEWCFNCNNGFYSNDSKGRPTQFCFSPCFEKIPSHILQELYSNPENRINILLNIPIVSSKGGSAFCSKECAAQFSAYNKKLETKLNELK